jgi:membrane protein implicated in regulation of membrane protease activity
MLAKVCEPTFTAVMYPLTALVAVASPVAWAAVPWYLETRALSASTMSFAVAVAWRNFFKGTETKDSRSTGPALAKAAHRRSDAVIEMRTMLAVKAGSDSVKRTVRLRRCRGGRGRSRTTS